MNKSAVFSHPEGSAERVVAHATWQRSRGRNPSMGFIIESNPRKALGLANSILRRDEWESVATLIGEAIVEAYSWDEMSDDQLKLAVRAIIKTSSSENEITCRVRDELDYPYDLSLFIEMPTDETGREARELVRGLGGLTTANGAMVIGEMSAKGGGVVSL